MAEPWLDLVEKLTELFAIDQIEASARQRGFVRGTSKITGKSFLAVMTIGAWSTPKTSLAQLAAKGAHLPTPVDLSPEALQQRRTRRAGAFLRALLQRAFAKLQTEDRGWEAALFAPVTAGHLADSTGFELPPSRKDLFAGRGGGASTAGAKMHLVWEYLSHSFAHLALGAGTTPDNKDSDTGVTCAQQGAWFLFA